MPTRIVRDGCSHWTIEQLRQAFVDVQRMLTDAPAATPGRLKATLFGPYFRWTGVDGMINPFGLEVLPNPDLLPFERPFIAAHEWAHLAGYADESEASFVGWLTCMHAGVPARYSGWLFLYWQINGEVDAAARARLCKRSVRAPREDIDGDRRTPSARPAPVAAHGGLAGVRPVSEGEPRRGGHPQLRRRRHAHSSRAFRSGLDSRPPRGRDSWFLTWSARSCLLIS